MANSLSALHSGILRLHAGDLLCTGRPGSSLRQYIALHLDSAQFAPQGPRVADNRSHLLRSMADLSPRDLWGVYLSLRHPAQGTGAAPPAEQAERHSLGEKPTNFG